jgi:DNA-binding XRE family transcriptional regulator
MGIGQARDTMSRVFMSMLVLSPAFLLWDTRQMSEAQPTLARRDLGIRLKGHRERVPLTPKQAADLLGYTVKTITRIEAGTHGTRRLVVEALVKHYGIEQDEASHLLSLVVRGAERGWWEDYVDKGTKEGTRPDFPMFLESEQIADHIRVLETEVVPGLLQTSEYLVSLQEAQLPIPPDVAEAVRGLRTHRQKLIYGRARPPRMEFLIGEGAIRYLDHLPDSVRDGQIRRLLEVAAMPNADVRVITQLHAGAAGAFNIITPSGGAPFVFGDLLHGCLYVEDPDIVSTYARSFAAAVGKSEPAEEYLR